MSYRAIAGTRPAFIGTEHAVSTAHFLSTAVGNRMLELGGNAIDAGVAAGIAMNTVMPYLTSFGGVAPIIVYLADRDEIFTISGVGRWPKAHTLEEHHRRWGEAIPNGISPVLVPAAPDAWLTALASFGTLTLREVLDPSIRLAEQGFPATDSYRYMVSKAESQEFLRQWPDAASILMPGGRLLRIGPTAVQPRSGPALQGPRGCRTVRLRQWQGGRYQGGKGPLLHRCTRRSDDSLRRGKRRHPDHGRHEGL